MKDKFKDHIKTLTKGQIKIKRKEIKLNILIKKTQKPDEKKKWKPQKLWQKIKAKKWGIKSTRTELKKLHIRIRIKELNRKQIKL